MEIRIFQVLWHIENERCNTVGFNRFKLDYGYHSHDVVTRTINHKRTK